MAEMSNKARVGEAFDLLASGMEPFIEFHMAKGSGPDWADKFARSSKVFESDYSTLDPSFQLNVVIDNWNSVFRSQLPRSVRNLLFTLRDKRNDWAHGARITVHDAQFTLGGVLTLLEAIDAREADQVRHSLDDLGRVMFEKERASNEGENSNIVDAPARGLKPWREVIHPHDDVAQGNFTMAEFAADLELVRRGEGSREYTDPKLFFERTYLTEGLRELLEKGARRIAGMGGQPVINCQTNFGGGKTHSLIALYHLFSGIPRNELTAEMAELLDSAGIDKPPTANRAVIVGNRFPAGQVHEKPDGTVVNTIWGEIAWQLGGAEGYAIVAESDRNRSNPGDLLRTVFQEYGPCLVLIDEWVAYARELYGRTDLPGGTFDSQFSFAQALTEAAKGVDGVLLVISIPASEGVSSIDDDTVISDLEVGGVAGRETLTRLTHLVSRTAEHWQPARGDESFEIVRRRLFQPLSEDAVADRDSVADAFGELYRKNKADFPQEAAEHRYVDRIKSAYPIHPELFDRLYLDWSTVERFQRTRGVLRLMASVIHSLWESDDKSPLILPASVPLHDSHVNGELTGKLDDHWRPVIEADVDGPGSRAAQIDRAVPALGSHHATRRVARTIFIGATPNIRSANKGLELDRIRLGSVLAGEPTGFIADALSRLSASAPYLYVDRDRYWFGLQENVNRTARDETDRLLAGDKHEVRAEIVDRLKAERGSGDFRSSHVAPLTSDDVADDPMARLVVLGPEAPHIAKADESPALSAAKSMLEHRGNSPRQYKNMLVFGVADQRALVGLEESAAEFLAWSSICNRVDEMNLDAHQVNQAKTRMQQTDDAIGLRLAEAYQYALVPRQDDPLGDVVFEVVRLDSQGTVAQRVSRKLVNDGNLQTQFPPVMLRLKLDNELSRRWESGAVSIATLWDDFAKYTYLPRLRDIDVLVQTAERGPASVTWESDGFAVAQGSDSVSGRYLELTVGSHPGTLTPTALVVKPEFAVGQIESEPPHGGGLGGSGGTEGHGSGDDDAGDGSKGLVVSTFRGSVRLDPDRPARDFGQVTQEVLQHFASAPGTTVEVRVEIVASKPDGFDDATVRTVTENARTLKFEANSGFEGD